MHVHESKRCCEGPPDGKEAGSGERLVTEDGMVESCCKARGGHPGR